MSHPLRTETLSIPSSSEQLEVVAHVVEAMAGEMGFSQDAIADLGICSTEAVMNAINHAHRQQEDLPVDITIRCYADRMEIVVRDHGEGFAPEKVPDPTEPENLLKQSGRGIMIMRAMMDDVDVVQLEDGTEITLVKKLD